MNDQDKQAYELCAMITTLRLASALNPDKPGRAIKLACVELLKTTTIQAVKASIGGIKRAYVPLATLNAMVKAIESQGMTWSIFASECDNAINNKGK